MLTHPLEPLSAHEVGDAVRLLQTSPEFTATTRIISVSLLEPPKTSVYEWPQTPYDGRRAEAVVFDNARNPAASVHLDLRLGHIDS